MHIIAIFFCVIIYQEDTSLIFIFGLCDIYPLEHQVATLDNNTIIPMAFNPS